MATDSFTASNGTQLTGYSANWSLGNALASDFIIDTNAIRTPFNRAITLFAYYSGSFSNDQFAEGKIAQVGSVGQYMGVVVRSGEGNGYGCYVTSGAFNVWKTVSYSWTSLASGGITLNAGDVIRLEVSGTTLTAKQNGSTLWSGADSALSSGAPGITGTGEAASGTYTLLDDWVGDDLVVAPPQFYQYDWPHQLHARR